MARENEIFKPDVAGLGTYLALFVLGTALLQLQSVRTITMTFFDSNRTGFRDSTPQTRYIVYAYPARNVRGTPTILILRNDLLCNIAGPRSLRNTYTYRSTRTATVPTAIYLPTSTSRDSASPPPISTPLAAAEAVPVPDSSWPRHHHVFSTSVCC
ncbi:hypothetical protein BV25DRAFT_1230661 [Artomyces pyxidatus]|uniref:Uncharacterized protein n=1 Tax=Artomyces pyxidatus TaxID=48021 RepID=A0ACB8SR54_9AGAM|nr:hypothetical protein BV25DRAFT_1230661 [Artomyces pyxidatus]